VPHFNALQALDFYVAVDPYLNDTTRFASIRDRNPIKKFLPVLTAYQ
jgi:anaerobic selenocysteine-containing dehydrogenase